MAYRFVNPAPVHFDVPGTELAKSGNLHFYETGTTTNKTTYSNTAGSIPNANPVPLDSSGRANTNIWLSGNYTAVLKDSLGATVWTRDIQPEAASGTILPALIADLFLTNNGSVMNWAAVRQVPDPTGSGGKILGTDGTALIWQAIAAVPPTITVVGNSFKIGTLLFQFGSDTFPASSVPPYHGTTKVVSFPIAFDSVLGVFGTVNKIGVVSNGDHGVLAESHTTTTSTFSMDINSAAVDSSRYITATTPFSWMAVGTKA